MKQITYPGHIIRQKLFWGIIITAGVIGALLWSWQIWNHYYGENQSHSIQAQLTGAVPGSFFVFGTHILDANPDKSDFSHPVLIRKVITDDKTKFLRTKWLLPTLQGFSNLPPPYYAKHGSTKPGSIDDLKGQRGILLVIKTADNSLNQDEIKAIEIDYALPGPNGYGFSGQVTKIQDRTVSVSGTPFMYNSPNMFMNQHSSTVKLSISSDTKFLKINSNALAEVTLAEFSADIAANKNVLLNALTKTSVYGVASFTPHQILYSISRVGVNQPK